MPPAPTSRPEQRLIRLAAGTVERRLLIRKQASLLTETDWHRLAETLRARRLLTLLGPRIIELCEGRAGAELVDAVEQALEAGRRKGGFLQLASVHIVSVLANAGITASVLKGPLFGEAVYGDLGRRPSNDLDLLVAADQLHAAVATARSLGYAAPVDHMYPDGLPLLHFTLPHEENRLPTLELHWRIHWYERRFAPERLLPPQPDPDCRWRPERADELLALLLFYARDGFLDLRLATDLSAWWDLHGAELQEGALEEVVSAYPQLAPAAIAAAIAAERVVGLPASRLVADAVRPRVRERLAARLADPNPDRSVAQLYADMGVVDGLLAPRGGLRGFVRRQLLPPREVLAQQARHGARSNPRSRLARFAGVLGRYVLVMTRLMRSGRRAL